jgi:hypothetical protein
MTRTEQQIQLKPRPLSRWALKADKVVGLNKDRGGWVSRHAIAWGFIYALLDIADAIRSRDPQ